MTEGNALFVTAVIGAMVTFAVVLFVVSWITNRSVLQQRQRTHDLPE